MGFMKTLLTIKKIEMEKPKKTGFFNMEKEALYLCRRCDGSGRKGSRCGAFCPECQGQGMYTHAKWDKSRMADIVAMRKEIRERELFDGTAQRRAEFEHFGFNH